MEMTMQFFGTMVGMFAIAGIVAVGVPMYFAARKREARAAMARNKNNLS